MMDFVFKPSLRLACDVTVRTLDDAAEFARTYVGPRLPHRRDRLCTVSKRYPFRRHAARLVLRCARVAGAVGIDVERPRGTLDDLFRDHDLLDAFEARQVEHGVEQDTFHDRAQ